MGGLDCLYGPGVNMHRTAYGGRNFEYYSEDAYLSGNKGLITGILRNEWGCEGWLISDNVRTDMITASAGILAGLTTFDAPLPIILNFEQYRNDPVMVTKMREACHYNLYALANSAAMNGIGENTTVDVVEYFMIPLFGWLAIVFALFSVFAMVKWYDGNRKWKEYVKVLK